MNGQLTVKPTNAFAISTSQAWLCFFFFIFVSMYFLFHIDQSHRLKCMIYVKLGASKISVNVASLQYDMQFRWRKVKDIIFAWDRIRECKCYSNILLRVHLFRFFQKPVELHS